MTIFPPNKIDLGFGFSEPSPGYEFVQLFNFNDQVALFSVEVI